MAEQGKQLGDMASRAASEAVKKTKK
jgi:hypothetical protein